MIIGLSGHAGSGKSTAARIIGDMGFQRRKFATPLKNMMRSLLHDMGFGLEAIEEMIEGRLKEVPMAQFDGRSPRYVMQTLGTDWARALISEDFWVNAATQAIEPTQRTVFDDCRFENEAAAIRRLGGVVIRIERPGIGPVNNHVSENLPDVDHVIYNDLGITDMRWNLYDYVKGLM